ncbi:uncharacterized protein EHS24_001301 [Apiotrichum porosum]|uniref:BolA-like protein 3 n=1 Tax=Apiotrichum porosum TaxID=105984 RepID=A0A427XK40_9TREE|nr:uncharacterized protein EHS24_001301 [Apiotrichum porosum]RSH79261.1 hypothetical protein EHS24_001301 [Apiotrichum porosum]
MSLRLSLSALRAPLARAQLASSSRTYATRVQPAGMGEGERGIWDKLNSRFPGTRLEVQDVSGGCGSFYAISISSPEFKGLSMIKQQRLVNDCLKEDIKGIHGLQLKTIVEDAE